MSLGSNLYQARRKSGLSQENAAEKLGVSRQTISKWETDETLPDIRQSKRLAVLYHMTLDELIEFDADEQEMQNMIWQGKRKKKYLIRLRQHLEKIWMDLGKTFRLQCSKVQMKKRRNLSF